MSKLDLSNFGQYFMEEAFDRLYQATSTGFQQQVGMKDFESICRAFKEGISTLEKWSEKPYLGTTKAIWVDQHKEKLIRLTYDANQVMTSFLLKPFVTYASDEQWTSNQYRMPINEEWFVFWGGTNEADNYHYAYEQQRYAYDLVQVKNDATFTGNPLLNEQYHAFGTDVVAPLHGTVVHVIDGLEDNVPGEMGGQHPAGNYVILEHPNEEYSMMAHLKQNSITVKKGDVMKEGQVVGQCGNSGNSSEAHIHFQVMDRPQLEQAKSIRIRFQQGYEPVQGDTVRP